MADLLLHFCCGPCAIFPVKILQEEGFSLLGWFMNPNIHPLAEYLRRRETAAECATRLGIKLLFEDEWNIEEWFAAQLPYLHKKARCERCCEQRLEAAAQKASQLGISCFSTSLLYSRYQPHEYIKKVSYELGEKYGVRFVYRDFRDHWQQGIDISKAWELYRQPYCGCIFSEYERYQKKLARLKKLQQFQLDIA